VMRADVHARLNLHRLQPVCCRPRRLAMATIEVLQTLHGAEPLDIR
jgi:hypothetical protein